MNDGDDSSQRQLEQTAQLAQEVKSELEDLCTRMRAGSKEAAIEFIELYGPHLRRIVRARLNERLRSKFDSLDFVQMVWASFFAGAQPLKNFEGPEKLIAYLTRIAQNKVVSEYRRRLQTEKYGISQECSLEDTDPEDAANSRRQATPSEVAIARERWARLLDGQPEVNRRVVEMRLSGATFLEISQTLEIHERTARKIVEKLFKANVSP